MGLLTVDQVKQKLAGTNGWEIQKNQIRKTFGFKDFQSSLMFVNKVGSIAESMNHHPSIEINYDKVTLSLSSHDSGGITEADVELSAKIEKVAND